MSEFDESAFRDMTVPEMTALFKTDFRQAWHQPVCVRGYLRVMHWVSFLCADQQAPPTILIQGPLVRDALRSKAAHQHGGSTLFEGPATIWSVGFKDGEIPGFAIQLFRPIRIEFASWSHPNESVMIDLPQPTSDRTEIEVLGRGELCSLVRLAERFSTAMLLERPEWIAACFDEADVLDELLFDYWLNSTGQTSLEPVIAKSRTLREMLQFLFRDYERCCRDHNLPLLYGRPISDRRSRFDEV